MLAVHPKFVIDGKARKTAVVVSLVEWERVMEALEELDDIREYDKAKGRRERSIPLEQVVRRFKARNRS